MGDSVTTTVSTKGQVILPKAIRERRKWAAGTRLIVEETPEGVLLKPAPFFKPTRPEDVAGMLHYKRKPKTIEEMDAAITAEVKARAVLAVDTNVIVRYLTRDDAEQFARANALIGREDLYISTTVLLETEWVLRRGYRFSRDRIVAALEAVAALPRVALEDPGLLATALGWAARGMDFADALHLAGSDRCDAFITFDRRLARRAAAVGAPTVRAP